MLRVFWKIKRFTLRKKCQMRENSDQKNSDYWHFSRRGIYVCLKISVFCLSSKKWGTDVNSTLLLVLRMSKLYLLSLYSWYCIPTEDKHIYYFLNILMTYSDVSLTSLLLWLNFKSIKWLFCNIYLDSQPQFTNLYLI